MQGQNLYLLSFSLIPIKNGVGLWLSGRKLYIASIIKFIGTLYKENKVKTVPTSNWICSFFNSGFMNNHIHYLFSCNIFFFLLSGNKKEPRPAES